MTIRQLCIGAVNQWSDLSTSGGGGGDPFYKLYGYAML